MTTTINLMRGNQQILTALKPGPLGHKAQRALLSPEDQQFVTQRNKRISAVETRGAKPVVLEGLCIDGKAPKDYGDWSGIAGSAEKALTVGYEDMRQLMGRGPVPVGRKSDFEVIEHAECYEVRIKPRA